MHLEEHAPSFFYQFKSVKSVFNFLPEATFEESGLI